MSDSIPTAAGYLHLAREIIADEKNWCKEYFAVDSKGEEIWGNDPKACSWCIGGALSRAFREGRDCLEKRRAVSMALDAVYDQLQQDELLTKWNDAPERTHAEVLKLLGVALTSLECDGMTEEARAVGSSPEPGL